MTAPPFDVAGVMGEAAFYPGHPEVVVRETHSAWVFLAGDRAYKVKKPVRMAFLDFSTLAHRRTVCHEEVRVNQALASSLEMRVRAIVARDGAYLFAAADAEDALEYAIEMRRFNEDQTMAAVLGHGELADDDVRAVADLLVRFHASARQHTPNDPLGEVKRTCDHNARELLGLADAQTAPRILAADRFASAFLVAHRELFVARAAAGRVRDCHGDLRAEHVVLEDPPAIVDRLEFDAHLREIDVADDLAFLVMDLERLGAGPVARQLVAAYREAGGDPGSEALIAFYGAYRALVRAKVDLLRADQLGEPDAARAARADAEALLDLAERFAWRARGPLVLAIGGPPASGKSTIAAELGRRSGWPVLSSDVTRKRTWGVAPDAPTPTELYSPAARAAVYGELGERARAAIDAGDGVLVDATFGESRLRAAFLDGLGDPVQLRAIECVTPAPLRDRWARARTAQTARGSDAAPGVAAALAARHTGWSELPERALLSVRPGGGAGVIAAQIADWLDTAASVVFPSDARSATHDAHVKRS